MKLKAFTLIELLIVVAIIAILAAIAVPNFLEAQVRSKVSRAKADIRTVGVAVESYCVDTNGKYPYCYPPYAEFDHRAGHLFLDVEWRDGSTQMTGMGKILTTPIAYIASIPWDPFVSRAYRHNPPWNWPGPPLNAAAMYIYGLNWDFVVDICGVTPGVPPDLYPQAGYAIYSYGPQCVLGWPPIIYDPTNGTVSRGLIMYLGKGRGFINRTGFESVDYFWH